MRVSRQRLAGLLVAGGMLLVGAAVAGAGERGAEEAAGAEGVAPDPAALITAMSRALRLLDYEGTFVHIQGMHVSSMHILHANDGRGELERMISLDGEAREVIRDHSLVTCIWPGSRSVVVSKARPRKLLPVIDVSMASNDSYFLEHAGTDRVAGLATEVVAITPRDGYRYGYRFWIDSETHMLLRSKLLDGSRTVEQVLFTRIEYPESIDRSRFEIRVEGDQLSWIEEAGGQAVGASGARATSGSLPFERSDKALAGGGTGPERAPDEAVDGADRVSFEGLPGGYVELSESYRAMPLDRVPSSGVTLDTPSGGGAPLSHVMVSDGMASVSVYVEHLDAREQDTSVTGLSSMGAVNAYGLSLGDGFVTVVGEVPPITVRRIAEAVRLRE